MAKDSITVWVQEDSHSVFVPSDIEEMYDEFLDESYGIVRIADMDFDTSRAYKMCAPNDYRMGLTQYVEQSRTDLHEMEMPLDVFLADDENVREAWILEELDK